MTSRQPSSGSIYKRKDGWWCASIRFDGKRHERRAKTKGEARQKLEALRRDVVEQKDVAKIRFRDTVERFLKHVKTHKAASTESSYRSVLEFTGSLNQYNLSELGPMAIADVIDGIPQAQTRHKLFKVLKACFNQAIAWELLTQADDPMRGLKTPDYSPAEPNPFEPHEVALVLAAAKSSRYLGAIQLAMMLGPRPAECWGFQWKDWDKGKQLRLVRQAAESGGKVEIKPPKTKSGTRTLLLPDTLVEVLEKRKRLAMMEGNANSDWIWPNVSGGVTRRNNFGYREWKQILATANVEHRGFHQCRHTAATTMLNNGVAIKLVSKILGHSKVSLTLDIYNSLMTADQNQAVEFWNRRLA